MIFSLFKYLEKNFFNSLTKKITGNLSFILLLQTAILAIVYYYHNKLTQITSKIPDVEIKQDINNILSSEFTLILISTLFIIFCIIIMIFVLRFLIVRPIKEIVDTLNEVGRGDGDMSKTLSANTHDEMRELSESYNLFIDKLSSMIREVRILGVHIGVDSAKTMSNVKVATVEAKKQDELSEIIYSASEKSTLSVEEVSANASQINQTTSENLINAKTSYNELVSITDKIQGISSMLGGFGETVKQLNTDSENIRQVVSLIQDISDQTNLLALNAAIEAARAGDAGRGFAVVADEVRKLAERVKSATEDISSNINGMIVQVKSTSEQTTIINQDINETKSVIENTSDNFQKMVSDFEDTSVGLENITGSMEDLTEVNDEIHSNVSEIHQLTLSVTNKMECSETSASNLNTKIEEVLELVSKFKIGKGYFETILSITESYKHTVEEKLTHYSNQGVNLFDKNYKQINGTIPQKYSTAYDKKVEKDLQAIYDRALNEIKGCSFCLCVDVNGYAPTHNSKYTKALTGNPEIDTTSSRDKRIFNDRAGSRAAKNTAELLLQAYARDTGEVLNDLSMPIIIEGKHWGALRIGFDPTVLLDQK